MKIFVFLFPLILTGCTALLPFDFTKESQTDADTKVAVFLDLLNSGWEIYRYKGKIILIKQTDSGILTNDVFGVLDQ